MLHHLSRQAAILGLLALAVVTAWCSIASPPPSRVGTMKITDTKLYSIVIERVRQGEPYYSTVTALQRENGAPVRPFVAVRLPTLAYIEAWLGPDGEQPVALALLAANALAFALIVRRAGASLVEQISCAGLVAAGGMLVFVPSLLVWHEIWTGLLLGLALAAMAEDRWVIAIVPAVLAVAIRELALPFVLLAFALALAKRNWREAAAWGAVVTAFALGLLAHRLMVDANVHVGDITSSGWSGMRGPSAIVDSFYDLTLLKAFPRPLAYLLSLLPLLGWMALPRGRGNFAVLFFVGYGLLLSLFARPDNYYWAEVMLPAWFAGLALAPRGLFLLVRRAAAREPAMGPANATP